MCDPALRGSLALGLLARLRSLRWLPAAPLRPGVGGSFKRSLKCGIVGSSNFRKCRISARASQRARKREVSSGAHVYIREFSKENSQLNETRYFSGSFKRSLKCSITENIDFRKCRISARASQRARKREVSSGAHVYPRVSEKTRS